MESPLNNVEKETDDKKMNFKNLEPLLQKCFKNKDLQVVDYTATKLLPAGENFSSIMVKIDANVRKNRNAKEEALHLVGKTPTPPEKSVGDWPLIFHKELYMYAEIFPLYRELEKEHGIDEKDTINILPAYIGYRNSLEDNGKIDENSVLLMENLKIKGFYNLDKITGIDVDHARIALTLLARYHALGVVMKQKRPSLAKKIIDRSRVLGVDYSEITIAFASICELLKENPRTKKHSEILEYVFEYKKYGQNETAAPIEPWATITHGDFWTNNILFHKDDEGKVDDVKFVDFQHYLYNSPLKDMALFVGCSLDVKAQTDHLEDLLTAYYDAFIKILKRMDCDASAFTKDSFDKEVKRQAVNEFLLNCLALKVFCFTSENNSNEISFNNMVNSKPSDAYMDKLISLVKVYEKMRWF